ncbi:MAG TPA: M20/M25/M40 family metallo-hydrolase [Blastocatellia bacterium]|nr:M20/M25/M40 family metallo-hydrolase [Blastocatellia bacterium]
MKRRIVTYLMLVCVLAQVATAQEPVDQQIISRIKTEAFQNSQAMETVSYLSDVYGARLSGSPSLKAASEWARDRMKQWGLENAQLEPWGTFGPGWSLNKFSAEMVEPQYVNLIAYPRAWSPSTDGVVSGKPVLVEVKSKADFDKYRGKLKGAIVMNGKPAPSPPSFKPEATRLTEEELAAKAQAINPGEPKSYLEEEEEWLKSLAQQNEIIKFFHDEGIALMIEPSARDYAIVRVSGFYNRNPQETYPAVVMAKEHYGRIARMLEKNVPVKLEFNLRTTFHTEDPTGYNVIAEIPGSDPRLKDEVVMLGGHIDSWHAATGATDNAAGCAVMMEAARILKAIGARPRRTIRVALWSGEEQDYYGSLGYVKKHFGDPETLALKPEHAKLSAYFNLDNGTGKIRGINIQGNEAVRPIFEAYLKPFHYLGATTVTTLNTGGTDHMPFDAVGLPGFQFIQDPIAYNTRTHHTNVDTVEHVIEDDLKISSAIVAAIAYHTAMRDEKLPREALPKPKAKANAAK